MAQVQQPWAWNLLLEFYNDPDPKLREEAFTSAVPRTRNCRRWRPPCSRSTRTSAGSPSRPSSRSTRRPPRRCSCRRWPTPTRTCGNWPWRRWSARTPGPAHRGAGQPSCRRARARGPGAGPARRQCGAGAAAGAGHRPGAAGARAPGRLAGPGGIGPGRACGTRRHAALAPLVPLLQSKHPSAAQTGGRRPGLGGAAAPSRNAPAGAPARRPAGEVPRRAGFGLCRRSARGVAGLLTAGGCRAVEGRAVRRGLHARARRRGPARPLPRRQRRERCARGR